MILGFPPVLCPSSIGVSICTVPTADAASSGDVSCYYFVVQLRFHGLWRRSARDIVAQRNDTWLARMYLYRNSQ